MRLHVAATAKYDDWARLTAALPDVPAAVYIYDGQRRTRLLAADFDPKPARPDDPASVAEAIAAVERDAARFIGWVRQAGGVVVVDRSTRGGVHVLVPFAAGESFRIDHLRPLLTLLDEQLPTLDTDPMRNPKKGCITAPGARCKTGGFRELVDMTLAEAVDALTTRSTPGLVARLVALIDPQRCLDTTQVSPLPSDRPHYTPGPAPSDRVPAPSTAPLRAWVADFLASGTAPDLQAPNGEPFTPSHARLSVLEQHAVRGWSLDDVTATRGRADWGGFWRAYEGRSDARKRLEIDWERAYTRAEQRLSGNAQKSSRSGHKPEREHTGGVRGIRWKLAAARRWILLSGEFTGQQQWTALLVVTALAYGISLGGGQSAAMGGRWLSIAAGLVGEDAVWTVLRKLRSIDGSPVRFLAVWNGREHAGDRYTLVEPRLDGRAVHAAEWEAYAARVEPVDPVWRLVGFAAWWVHEILRAIEGEPGDRIEPRQLAAAAHVSLSTVHRAAKDLAEHGFVDQGHGWIARTGRSPRRVPQLTADADALLQDRLTRHRKQRSDFYSFIDIIEANYRTHEIAGYASLADLHQDDAAYWATRMREGPPEAVPGVADCSTAGPTGHEESEEEDDDVEAVVALLTEQLGAVLIASS